MSMPKFNHNSNLYNMGGELTRQNYNRGEREEITN